MPPTVSKPIPSAISAALETNISLQSELQRLLQKIKCKKVLNRRNAARVMKYCRIEGDHSQRMTVSATVGGTSMTISESNDSIQSVSTENLTRGKPDECSATIAIDEADLSKAKDATEFPPRKKTKLACNSNRKKMRRFFMDKDGSTPESMMWGIGRENEAGQPASVIFERNHQSRISADEEVPKSTWKKAKRCAWKDDTFEEVSIKIVNMPSRPEENRLLPCFSFADPKTAATKLTKQECNFVTSMIQKSGGNKHNSIDWYNFAIEHYDKINQQSPWRCFCLFRSSLQNLSTWSPDEDELLLKYLASHGPQYLLQGDCAVQTCRNLFPDRSTKQVILRAQSTLINPNYVQNAWDTNEKRKLALLVRAYSNKPHPINSASRPIHFSHRAPKSVTEKWINTLNPAMYHPST